MYGMVNRAIEDLVVSSVGRDAWEQIKSHVDDDVPEFFDSAQYDDAITYGLISAASQVLEQSPESILRAFGRHWILYTGKEGWASVFELGGDSMIEYINGLDSMHARVQIALPNAQMPQFSVTEKDGYFELIYRSERKGFAPMVLGLLDGLVEQFGENWSIEHVSSNEADGSDIFALRQVSDQTTAATSNAA